MLTKHNGHIALDQLERLYTEEFGAPVYPEVRKYLKKRLPHESFLVANLASHRWLVWAPTGHPSCRYQSSGTPPISSGEESGRGFEAEGSSFPSDSPPLSSATFDTAHPLLSGELPSVMDDNFVIDLSGIPLKSKPVSFTSRDDEEELEPVSAPATLEPVSVLPELKSDSAPAMLELVSEPKPVSAPAELDSIAAPPVELKPDLSLSLEPSKSLGFSMDDEEGMEATPSSNHTPESPYDFLKDHPDLIAELSKPSNFAGFEGPMPPADDLKIITEVLTLQRLRELGIGIGKPASPPPSSSPGPRGSSVSVPADPPVAAPRPPGKKLPPNPTAADYLESSLTPDEVLAELQQLKERNGGVLCPAEMAPFLDYFGELSSRELDRIDALEGKKPKKVGGGRAKRNMAIRFPSQNPASASSTAMATAGTSQGLYDETFPVGKLPVADFGDSSDSSTDDNPVVPITRNEYIRRFLEGGDPDNNIVDQDELSALHSKLDKELAGSSTSAMDGLGFGGEMPRPLLPPSESNTGSFEALFDPSNMNF